MAQVTGKGSIIALEKPERTCHKWQLRVSIGRDYITGNYVTKTRRTTGTKTHAQAELRAFINEIESGIRIDTMSLTFGEFAERWYQERVMAGNVELGTLRKNDYHIRLALPYIGNVRLLDLNAETISSLYITLKNGGSLSGKPLTGATLNGVAVTLGGILKEAVNRDIILRNPCDKVKNPRNDTREKEALTLAQTRKLIARLCEGDPTAYTIAILLAVTCGLRREELCGLRWRNLDAENGILSIADVLPVDSLRLQKPKTAASRRRIPLDRQTLARVDDWRITQSKDFLAHGICRDADTPIVNSDYYGFMNPQRLGNWWSKNRASFGVDVTLHQLRHTFATLLVANGIDLVTAKNLMGHADTNILTKIYAHCVDENLSKATETIGRLVYSGPEAAKVIEVRPARLA